LAVYAEEGVSGACLTLQDRLDVDVNVVLFAAYLGAVRAETLTDAGLAAAVDLVGSWHRDVVRPLRSVRRRLEDHLAADPGAQAAAQLRGGLQRLEIDAEMIELDDLGALAAAEVRPPASGGPAERAAAAILVVAAARGEIHDDLRAAVDLIASAAALRSGRST
jgi:uncharacterized protein (TIGR02444 family)